MLCGTTSLLQINLFKKQKTTSVPLGWAQVFHHWSSCKPLDRDVVLTGKSSEKPHKSELDPSVTPPKLSKLQLRPAAVCYLGQCNNLTRKDGSLTRKEMTLWGIPRWGFSWRRRFFSPYPLLTSLMARAGTMDSRWQKENVETRRSFNRLHMEKGSCVWAMESPASHSQAQDMGSATEDGEGRKGQVTWWQIPLQHSWHQHTEAAHEEKWAHCSNMRRGEHHVTVWHLHGNEGILPAGIQRQPKVP